MHLASPEEQRILALAQDLSAIWHAPTTTHAERKQLLRFLIKDVTLTRQEETIHRLGHAHPVAVVGAQRRC